MSENCRTIYTIDDLPLVIPIGVQSESGVEEIRFDVKPWLDAWDGLDLSVWPTRPGETAAYPAADVELVGSVLYWRPNDSDTAIPGEGTVEVVGITADKRKLSGACKTVCKPTTLATTKEPPEGIKPYYDGIIEAAQGVKASNASKVNVNQGEENAGKLLMIGQTGEVGPGDMDAQNIFLCTVHDWYSDKSQEEILAAVAAGKSCFLRHHNGKMFVYTGVENDMPTFMRPLEYEWGVGCKQQFCRVDATGRAVVYNNDPVKTPNPNALTVKQGDKSTTYDGSAGVEIEIESGVPDPGTAHQMLVSDADGKAVWTDLLAYKTTGTVEYLPETTLTSEGMDEGIFGYLEQLSTVPEDGVTCQIVYNGAEWESPCVVVSENGATFALLGNVALFGATGGNPDAPFAIMIPANDATFATVGAGMVFVTTDGATSVILSITGEGTSIKRIEADLVVPQVTLTVSEDNSVTSDTPMNKLWELTPAQIQMAVTIKREMNNAVEYYTVDSVTKREQAGAAAKAHIIQMRVRMLYMDDTSPVHDPIYYLSWLETYDDNGAVTGTVLTIDDSFTFGGLPHWMNGGTAGTYLRHAGNNRWEDVTIDQLKADLGLT